jgi:hypothetical protein
MALSHIEMSLMTRAKLKDSQLRQTEDGADQTIVALAKAWIEFSVRDGEETSANATAKVAELQNHLLQIQSAATQIQEDPGNVEAHFALSQQVSESVAHMSDTIVALQFFDRVSQRLMHAKHFLEVGSAEDHAPLTSVLAMRDESVLFDAVISGMAEDEAIKLANESLDHTVHHDDENDIDLF